MDPNEDDLKEISDKSSKDDVQTTQRRLKQSDEWNKEVNKIWE